MYDVLEFILFLFSLFIIIKLRFARNYKRVYVVVLGDVGRSPRMQYHSLSLAQRGYQVYLFGYGGSIPHDNIFNNPSITIVNLLEPSYLLKSLPKSLGLFLKFAWLFVALSLKLCTQPRPSYILIQNPPSIPSLMVAVMVGLLRGAKVVVDWHNYGFTIMSLVCPPQSIVVRIYKWCEFTFGRLAHAHICVTEAMKDDLANKYNIKATTLHDRPPEIFRILDNIQKHQFFSQFSPLFDPEQIGVSSVSRLNELGQVEFKEDRPALVVSSTSWTPDEDFSILFEAFHDYNEAALNNDNALPNIVCIVTGKGPLKEHYMSLIGQKNWVKVRVLMVWLRAEEYPVLLGACDLGVSLHCSSNGLDLPMKVVDMFGCGLPVCSVKYPAIGELVKDGMNGLLFETSQQLTKHLMYLLEDFPKGNGKLEKMKKTLEKKRDGWRWDENWEREVAGVFE